MPNHFQNLNFLLELVHVYFFADFSGCEQIILKTIFSIFYFLLNRQKATHIPHIFIVDILWIVGFTARKAKQLRLLTVQH